MTFPRRDALLLLLLTVASVVGLAVAFRTPQPEASAVATDEPLTEGVERAQTRRARRHVSLREGRPDAPAVTADGPPEELDDSPAAESEAAAARQVAMTEQALDALTDRILQIELVDDTVHAVIAPDPVTGRARDVSTGEAAPMPLRQYVQRGPRDVHGAVELVGARRPQLEDGAPVSLSGRVLAADDESPVVGASVIVSSTFYVRATFYDHHLREVARVVTDTEGRWTVERLNADPAHFGRGGKAYVTVTADGFAPALAVPVADLSPGVANRLEEIALDRSPHVLRGRVIDTTAGVPVVGATVFATGAIDPVVYPKDQRDALFVGAPTAVTDVDGRFVLEGLGAGAQMISVHGGDDCVGRGSFRMPVEGEVTLRTRAIRGRIEGEIVDGRGAPVPLVMVNGGGNSTHSFADGRFVLENFRGDRIAMTFSHPEFVPTRVGDVPDGSAELVVRMERRQPVVILDVRHADHEAPITHVVVTFAYPEGVAPGPQTSPHHLSESGRHGVGIPDGALSMTITAAGYESRTLDIVAGMDGDTVVVTLPPVAAD